MIYGYIRVSSDKQTVENQRFEINKFCQNQNIVIDDWIEETISGTKNYTKRQLGILLKKVNKDDIIICSELSRLGRNLFMIMEILNICMTKECRVWTIKDNYRLGDDIQSKVLAFAFGLSAEIERNLISQRTKEALARKKAEGVTLGRPKGRRSSPDKYKLSGKEILMGKQSSLGPIDPQMNGIPAFSVVDEFEEAKEDLKTGYGSFDYWRILLSKYPAAFVKQSKDAIDLAGSLLREWLKTGMLENESGTIIDNVCNALNEHEKSKNHSRHFDFKYCQDIGLKIQMLEDDQFLQDLVLSVHHSCMHTFGFTKAVKIIENQNGKAFINLSK